jgi:NAD(P)-dependent dehydrogenase (short-subunit alcohol dehydrogenase family)
MNELQLNNKLVLITGAAKRIGRSLAYACARAGADVFIHYSHSEKEAIETLEQIKSLGRHAWIMPADLSRPNEISDLLQQVSNKGSLYALVNNAAMFEPLSIQDTKLADWEKHFAVNLRAPFLLSQGFAKQIEKDRTGRIVNILDWRALRPGADHFPYTVSKAALAAMTKSLAMALAPNIAVNGLALGAILPPVDKPVPADILKYVPAARWGGLSEIEEALIFLLAGPAYITGEILQIDGGRHLV